MNKTEFEQIKILKEQFLLRLEQSDYILAGIKRKDLSTQEITVANMLCKEGVLIKSISSKKNRQVTYFKK